MAFDGILFISYYALPEIGYTHSSACHHNDEVVVVVAAAAAEAAMMTAALNVGLFVRRMVCDMF